MNNATIESYTKCACGAITLTFDNGATNSMRPATAKKLGIDLRHYKRYKPTYYCDHCVNHWGIDLCKCGSGKPVGKCKCGLNEAHDEFGVKFDSLAAIMKGFYMA